MMPEMGTMILAAAAFLALIAVVVLLALRRRGPDPASVFQQQSELAGRLAQMAEQSAAAQAQMATQLREQESAIATLLEQRLGQVDKRLNEGLEQSRNATQTTIADVRERLVKIDEAQKNIAQLSTHVVGLSDILSNKQARGAFGEEQLEITDLPSGDSTGRLDGHLDALASLSYFFTDWFSVGIVDKLDWRLTNATDPTNGNSFGFLRNQTFVLASVTY